MGWETQPLRIEQLDWGWVSQFLFNPIYMLSKVNMLNLATRVTLMNQLFLRFTHHVSLS